MSIFGPIFTAHTLELKVLETMSIWMPTYLREIEDQMGRTLGQIIPPRTYTTRNEFTTFPEDQMPICVVISPGLSGEPYTEGNGTTSAWWSIGIGVLVSARDEEATNFLSKVYGAAVRAIMLQQSDLGGICSGVNWLDESYDDVPDEAQERTIRAAQWIGSVCIDNVVLKGGGPVGPPDPITQPGSDWVVATTGDIIVQKEED